MSKGQSRTHNPQRIQAAKKSSSFFTPGGRSAYAGKDLASFVYKPKPTPNKATPLAVRAVSTINRLRLNWCSNTLAFLYYAFVTLTAHFL